MGEGLVPARGVRRQRHAGVFRDFPDAPSSGSASSTSRFCPGRFGLAKRGCVDHNM